MAGKLKTRITGFSLFAFGLYLGVCLFTYDKWDASLLTDTANAPRNLGGALGAYLADMAITLLGIASFALPVFLVVRGIKIFFRRPGFRVHLVGAVLFVLSGSLLLAMMQSSFDLEYGAGGLLGTLAGKFMVGVLTLPGAYVVSWGVLMASLILLSPMALINFLLKAEAPSASGPGPEEPVIMDIDEASLEEGEEGEEEETLEPEILLKDNAGAYEDLDIAEIVDEDGAGGPVVTEGVMLDEDEEALLGAIPIDPDPVGPVGGGKAHSPASRRKKRKYEIPPLSMLHVYDPPIRRSREEYVRDSRLLESKLEDFSVKGRVTQVHPGPVVTMNEYEPAPGVKINRVVSLSDDLALALKAPSIRISMVPGTSSLGIEVPNHDRETVALKDIVDSENFAASESRLTLAFGKDIFGSPVVADLTRMPHLMVAGATGSGKSVFMNALIVSILYKAKPEEVKMLMIDPKLLELSVYDGIPHLVAPVVTNPKDASEMLRRMVFEMESRYRLLAEKGVRNIDGYNELVPAEEKLPYIVVFIDELADLMLASAAQVEDSIARLAQMARASGIHLVIATQRPSVDVITGVIKANFSARVAFQVTTRVDSRTILDAQGAEQLIGRGDMLFMLPGKRLLRVHGALVTEAEVKAIVGHVKDQGEPDYTIMQAIAEAQENARVDAEYSEDRDELFWKAVDHAEAVSEVSISSVQRKLKVGYNRAARIMEMMEEDGMVGPPKGAGKPRDFLGRNMR